jgi:hypothetical protein
VSRFAWIVVFAVSAASPAAADSGIPDFRGVWKGESESIVLGAGNDHHLATQSNEPEMRTVRFTLSVDRQEGRRFSGTFSSPRSSEKVIAVYSRSGAILMADNEGYTHGTMLGPDRMELCYLHVSTAARIASCTELTKQK